MSQYRDFMEFQFLIIFLVWVKDDGRRRFHIITHCQYTVYSLKPGVYIYYIYISIVKITVIRVQGHLQPVTRKRNDQSINQSINQSIKSNPIQFNPIQSNPIQSNQSINSLFSFGRHVKQGIRLMHRQPWQSIPEIRRDTSRVMYSLLGRWVWMDGFFGGNWWWWWCHTSTVECTPVNKHSNLKIHGLKIYFLLETVDFHCYVSLPECIIIYMYMLQGERAGGLCHLIDAFQNSFRSLVQDVETASSSAISGVDHDQTFGHNAWTHWS